MYQTIRYEKKDGIGIATINRPEALNALNTTVVSDLESLVADVEKDTELVGLVITGEGRSFVAGADIGEQRDYNLVQARNWSRRGAILFRRLEKLGVRTAHSVADIPDGVPVLIRAHGVTRAVYEALAAKGCTVYDATCPFVAKIHKIVQQESEAGRRIIILGSKNHPEVLVDTLFAAVLALVRFLPAREAKEKFCAELCVCIEKYRSHIVLECIGFPQNYKQLLKSEEKYA